MSGAVLRLIGMGVLLGVLLIAAAIRLGQSALDSVIAYTSATSSSASDLDLIDLVTRATVNLTRTPASYEDHAAWSGDGSLLAYQRVEGSLSQICVLAVTCYAPAGSWDHAPEWSGRWLVFLSSDTMLFMRDTLGEAPLMHVGTSDRLLFDPSWSPDGSRIAFVESASGSLITRLYLTGRDLTDTRLIDTQGLQVSSPVWSPDGTRLAFVGQHSRLDQNIYLLDLASGTFQRLTSGNSDGFPAWSPDSQRLAFVSNRSGNPEIFVIDADGTHERQLTHSAALDGMPLWSPDGTRLVFVSDRDGGFHLYLLDAASGSIQRLTYGSGDQFDPAWRP